MQEGKKRKNIKKEEVDITACALTSLYRVLRKDLKEDVWMSNENKSEMELTRIRSLTWPGGCRSLTVPRGAVTFL